MCGVRLSTVNLCQERLDAFFPLKPTFMVFSCFVIQPVLSSKNISQLWWQLVMLFSLVKDLVVLLQTGASTGTQQRLNPTGPRKHRWSPNKQEIVNKWLDLWCLSVWREHASNIFQPCTSLLKSSLFVSWRGLTDPAGWEISYTLGLFSCLSFGLQYKKNLKW